MRPRDVLVVLRSLIFGETWILPIAVGAAVVVIAGVRIIGGPAFFEDAGGPIALGLTAVAVSATLRRG